MQRKTDPTMRIKTSRQIGQAVRAKRTSLGLTQQEVAEGSSVARSFVNRLEAGTATAIYPEKLLSVLDFLGLDLLVEDGGQADTDECEAESDSPATWPTGFETEPPRTPPSQPRQPLASKPQNPLSENADYKQFIQSLTPSLDLLKPRTTKHERSPHEGDAYE